MFDILQEKGSVVSKLGSFWTKLLEDDASYTPNGLAHIPFIAKCKHKLMHILKMALGTPRDTTGEFIYRFNDRHVLGNLLLTPADTLITAILTDNGVLTKDVQFKSGYGYVMFDKDPRALFPELRIHIKGAVKRYENILNYPLGTYGVVGDILQILDYYRNNLSAKQLYKASALACGMVVVAEDDIILNVILLDTDKTVYITLKGHRYDVWYAHNLLELDSKISAGSVIGQELYKIYTKYDDIADIDSVAMLHTCPVAGIKIQNLDNITLYRDGKFKPDYLGTNILKFWDYLDAVGAADLPNELPDKGNPLKHFMEVVARNRVVVVQISADMPQSMRKNLHIFLQTNAPIGSVLLYA